MSEESAAPEAPEIDQPSCPRCTICGDIAASENVPHRKIENRFFCIHCYRDRSDYAKMLLLATTLDELRRMEHSSQPSNWVQRIRSRIGDIFQLAENMLYVDRGGHPSDL